MPKRFFKMALFTATLLAGCGTPSPDKVVHEIHTNVYVNFVPETLPRLEGFVFPVPDAVLPQSDQLMPGAPREYRHGVHRGVDISYRDGGDERVSFGDPVVAMAEARVVRADHDYQELTRQQRLTLLKATRILGGRATDVLDALMGRQVWLLTPDGILLKYGHLSAVERHVRGEAIVRRGDMIGRIGNSGMSAAASGSEMGAHLHFEIWIGNRYLGQGKSPDEVRRFYLRLFSKSFDGSQGPRHEEIKGLEH